MLPKAPTVRYQPESAAPGTSAARIMSGPMRPTGGPWFSSQVHAWPGVVVNWFLVKVQLPFRQLMAPSDPQIPALPNPASVTVQALGAAPFPEQPQPWAL